MNARELARWFAAAGAAGELLREGFPFPSEYEHLEASERSGVRVSDPSTWLRKHLEQAPSPVTPIFQSPHGSSRTRTAGRASRQGRGVGGPPRE